MLDKIKALWGALSMPGKLILVLTSPLLVGLYFLTVFIERQFDTTTAKKVEEKSSEYDKKESDTDKTIATEDGKIDQLTQDKAQALKDAENDKPKPVDFFNSRNYDTDK
jgi:hypothetical protein